MQTKVEDIPRNRLNHEGPIHPSNRHVCYGLGHFRIVHATTDLRQVLEIMAIRQLTAAGRGRLFYSEPLKNQHLCFDGPRDGAT